MSNITTPKAPRKRKAAAPVVPTPVVETPAETPAPSQEIVKAEPKPLTPAQARKAAATLAANVEKLQTLTAVAKEGLEQSADAEATAAEAFRTAAQALQTIRDEQLVEKVTKDGEKPLTFKQYVEETFNRSRDLGDKWARAGQVLARLQKELGEKVADYPLPLNEAQARGLTVLLTADPNGKAKLVSKAWTQAFDNARTEAEVEAAKGGFVAPVSSPTTRHIVAAREAVRPKRVATASTSGPKADPAPTAKGLPADATDLDKSILKLYQGTYSEIKFATFSALLIEGAKIGAAAAVVRQSCDAVSAAL